MLWSFSLVAPCLGLIPRSPQEQTKRAIASIKSAIEENRNNDSDNKPCRLYVDYLVPIPPETNEADVDPWPGGLAQMYPYAEDILSDILYGVVDEPNGKCTSQVISASDCCGLLIQESKTSAKNDIAAILFPGVDQLDTIEQIESMVGKERTLLIFNKQFQRPSDFGFNLMSGGPFGGGGGSNTGGNTKADKLIFNQYKYGFAFQEFACRGEDTKLVYEHPTGWYSCVICDEDVDLGRREIELLPTSKEDERPDYKSLEKKIGEVLPEPLWMRKMGEAETKGLKFQRGGGSGGN